MEILRRFRRDFIYQNQKTESYATMTLNRYGKKRDANEIEIVAALRKIGATVIYLSEPNAPDLLIGYKNKTYLIEVKTPRSKLKPGQRQFFSDWKGGPCSIAHNVGDALRTLNVYV